MTKQKVKAWLILTTDEKEIWRVYFGDKKHALAVAKIESKEWDIELKVKKCIVEF